MVNKVQSVSVCVCRCWRKVGT